MIKRLIIILFVLCVAVPSHAWEVEGRVSRMLYDNPEIRAGNSIELRVKNKGVFLFGERDNLLMYGSYFNIDSLGVGFEHEVFDGLKLYAKAGVYIPQYDEDGFFWEALYYRQIKYWVPPLKDHKFDNYNVNFDSEVGGEIGLDFKKRVWEDLHLGITAGYRYLRINEYICGWNDGGAAGVTGWILEQNVDFGGWNVGATVEWRF